MTALHFISSVFLGLVQGVAEFLPISSSGHLSLFQTFFGLEEAGLFFDVLLHLGTLIAIFVYYWKDIVGLVKEFIRIVACLFSKEKRAAMGRLSPKGRMILMIIVATLPLFVVLPIKDKVEGLYTNTIFVGCALIVTGCILFFSDRMARGKKTAKSATLLDALLVGVGQAIAVVPGLSRSGTTISAGMMRGFSRKFAVRFSFLLSIPAVLGANILSIGEAVSAGIDLSLLPGYIAGTVVAAVSGYFAIRLVNLLADKGKFGNFAYYCWGIGAAAVVATLIFK
ncbi:MAG: undecaprenyl-diphosphate phosphatase [Bacillota bacterium]|nr:undecaprenyl-diphosphate phosphatase [Bacillota bacterium]